MEIMTMPDVFAPRSDSWLLADAVAADPAVPGATVLDLCTGSGIVAVAAALAGGRVTAVDVSEEALENVLLNASSAGASLRVRCGSLFEPVGSERFDVIVSNPPYVPSVTDALPASGPERAWAAGRSGRLVLDEIISGALDHLAPAGVLLIVHSSLIGEARTIEQLDAAGFATVDVVERSSGPLGPLMKEQQRAGTVPATAQEEDVIVVRAVAPATDTTGAGRRADENGQTS
jgi:release factor glutamine methyltransferase